jgi:hypothetical protein
MGRRRKNQTGVMTMKNVQMAAIVCLVLFIAGCGRSPLTGGNAESSQAAKQAAVQSAQAWLDVVDGGGYAKSWQDTAAVFQTAVSQADWEKAVQAARAPLGRMTSRKIKSQQYATSLPGAPDGQYVVIQYDTDFENKPAAVETVTPMLEKDGQWKVSGYYVK